MVEIINILLTRIAYTHEDFHGKEDKDHPTNGFRKQFYHPNRKGKLLEDKETQRTNTSEKVLF